MVRKMSAGMILQQKKMKKVASLWRSKTEAFRKKQNWIEFVKKNINKV